MYDLDLLEHTDMVNELLARYGVKFGIYKKRAGCLRLYDKPRGHKGRRKPDTDHPGECGGNFHVTGIHGDELEGQYVCFELIRRIQEQKDKLTGIVDIYPAMNPLGIDSVTRGIPAFDLDMNRLFPGNQEGGMT